MCEKGGLLLSGLKKVAEKRIVCQNEYYIHVKGTMVDLLMKTELAEREEKGEYIHAQMALN